MHKQKRNIIFNQNFPIFSLFCLLGVLYLGFVVDYWYLLLIVIWPLTIKKIKPNKWQIIILFCILITFVMLMVLVPNFSLVSTYNKWFNKLTNGGPKNWFDNFFHKYYPDETIDFVKLVLFNVKSNHTYVFLKQTIDLGIVWLISSGGFHLSLISRVVNKIFKKKQLIALCTNIVILTIYSFFLGFAYGCLRVLFKTYFRVMFTRTKTGRFNQLGFVGVLICLLNPACFSSYSFLLSFTVCIASYGIIELSLNNKLISTLLINIVAFVATIPFVISMNHKISFLTFVNSFIFTYYFVFIFLYFFIFTWFPFMAIIHYWIIRISYVLVGNISFSNVYIWSNDWPIWAYNIYFLCFTSIFKITYLIVYNNKI